MDESVLKLTEVEPRTSTGSLGDDSTGCYLDRPGEVLKRKRLEPLNEEERKERIHAWTTRIFFIYLARC